MEVAWQALLLGTLPILLNRYINLIIFLHYWIAAILTIKFQLKITRILNCVQQVINRLAHPICVGWAEDVHRQLEESNPIFSISPAGSPVLFITALIRLSMNLNQAKMDDKILTMCSCTKTEENSTLHGPGFSVCTKKA